MKLLIFLALLALSQAAIVGGYKEIDAKELDTSQNLKSLLDFGTQQFIQKASDENKLTDTKLTLTKVNHVYSQVVAGMNYKFHAYISDAKNRTLLDSNYTVYQNLNGTYSLSQWKYKILKGAKKPVKKTL